MLESVHLQGFRSVRKVSLQLEQLNVIVGANGCGKSNLYQAMHLLHQAATGRLSAALAEAGGIQKAMWAGGARRGDALKAPKRIILAARMTDFEYELQIGYPEPSNSMFKLDPLVKEESLWLSANARRPSALLLERRNQSAFLTSVDGVRTPYPIGLYEEESIFGQLAEPHLYPEISQVRELLRQWRFYHAFESGRASPLRTPQVGIRSARLAHDGRNLAAAFRTIEEIGDRELLHSILADAFPDTTFHIEAQQGRFQLMMQRDAILRPLDASELSDGTLRFVCLAVAMLSPRPPGFMAFNEPENSLHPELIPALARLIALASHHSQLWITSHSPQLADAIARHGPLRRFSLALNDGETVLREGA
jgi:predicted ATPase